VATDRTFDLQRFVAAQLPMMNRVRAELRAGRKQGHWMWFVFPQIAGLGRSAMAVRYAIASLEEARAYLAHPILGPRLKECAQLVLDIEGRAIEVIFGHPDDVKFQSSMTLFAQAAPLDKVFGDALSKYFNGRPDAATVDQLL
jgi:uncharacterized protein (DUF1810 family)